MQNRWEAETQQRGVDAAKAQVSKAPSTGRPRDRWATSSDNQTPSVDSHTVPSSRFTRPTVTTDTVSPPSSPSPYQQQPPQSPRSNETKVFSRPPLVHQKSSTTSSGVEALTRQMSLSSMGGNDTSTINGQPTVLVKETKVTPSTELVGAVTRAKDSKFEIFYIFEKKNKFRMNFFQACTKQQQNRHHLQYLVLVYLLNCLMHYYQNLVRIMIFSGNVLLTKYFHEN
jgi:hypothetical protein